jgi:excisionase family DNA binding protein
VATAKKDLATSRVQGQPELMVPVEAAEFLRVSLDQLYHLTSKKKVPFLKVGGQLRFERGQLVEVLGQASIPAVDDRPRETGRRSPGRAAVAIRSTEAKRAAARFEFKTPRRPR